MSMAGSLGGIRFPGKYIQGPGALSQLGAQVALFGTAPVVIVDHALFDTLSPLVNMAFSSTHAPLLLRHDKECSQSEIDRIAEAARGYNAGVMVGIGGGKVLDTAKAAAGELGLAAVVVPTIAASDAPCSALSVIYRDDGTVLHDRFLPRNPDLVLVDTTIIARAPTRFLAAGIGDALATWYEAEACRQSGVANCMGLKGLALASHIARFCQQTIMEHGAEALAQCDLDHPGDALERVVEANILMSGIGFESGGVAAAHAIHHGLCELPDVHHHLHGEKVVIGVLAGLLLHDRGAEFERIREFCASVRLPVRLADIGITDASPDQLRIVADRATRAGEIIHNEPIPITPDMVVAALTRLK